MTLISETLREIYDAAEGKSVAIPTYESFLEQLDGAIKIARARDNAKIEQLEKDVNHLWQIAYDLATLPQSDASLVVHLRELLKLRGAR